MAENTNIPQGLPAGVPLVRVADQNGIVSFVPIQGVVDSFGDVTFFETLRQPSRTDAPESTQVITSQNLVSDNRSGTLPSNGLQIAATQFTPDPEDSDRFLRNTAGDVYGQGTGADAALTDRQAIDVRAFLYGYNATGTDAKPVRVNDSNEVVVTTAQSVPTTITTVADQATAVGSNTSIAAVNVNRRQIIIQNVDATDAVRIGDTNITTTRGIRLGAGESVTLEVTAQIFARAEANTPNVAVTEIE